MIKIGLHYNDVEIESRVRYTISFINSHPVFSQHLEFCINTKCEKNLYYGQQKKGNYYVPKLGLLFARNDFDPMKLVSNPYKYNSSLLRSIDIEISEFGNFINVDGHFSFDIFETIFFHISRIEELSPESSHLNDRGLLDEAAYFVIRNRIHKEPVVDNIIASMIEIMCGISLSLKSEIIVTHDIDHIKKFASPIKFPRNIIGSILRGNISNVGNLTRKYITYLRTGQDPYNVFDWMLSKGTHQKYIFYLVGGQHKYDTPIPLNNQSFLNSIQIALNRNYHIGIHPSFESSQKPELVSIEKKQIEKLSKVSVNASRQHYLQFDINHSIQTLIDSGIELDSSLGFNSTTGFRCGTGFKYYLYDFKNEQKSTLTELPLVFMDSALLKESNFDYQNCLKEMKWFIDLKNTCICINFHNSRFEDALADKIPLKKIYDRLLNS